MDSEVELTQEQYNLFKALPKVANADHPLSLGYHVVLLSDHPTFGTNTRDLRFFDELYAGWVTVSGLHLVHNKPKCITLVIRNTKSPEGADLPLGRVVEVIVHEVSHLVDGFFGRTGLDVVDTELRAYYNDWLVGKVLHLADPTVWFADQVSCERD